MKRLPLLIALLASVLAAFMPAASLATSWNWQPGYFLHIVNPNGGCGGNVIQDGFDEGSRTMNADRFIKLEHQNLRDTGNAGQNQVGMAYIIDTMLGKPTSDWGPPTGRSRGIQYAFDHEDDWANLIRAYEDRGWINWGNAGHVFNIPGNSYETTEWEGNNDCRGQGIKYVPGKPNDVAAFTWDLDMTNRQMISFNNPDGTWYRIDRHCGNPMGKSHALQNPFDIQLTADRGTSPLTLGQNQTYDLAVHLHNLGPGASDPGHLQVMWPTANVCKPGASCPASQTDLSNGYSTGKGFRNNSVVPGATGPNWYWDVKAIPGSGRTSASATLNFTTLPNAAPGANIDFDVYYYPGDYKGAVEHAIVHFRMDIVRYPSVEGQSGDVHAGGQLCGQTGTPPAHTITGSNKTNSLGEYVVSATGQVASFGSNNSPTSTSARLGSRGNYQDVCRPDLVAAATTYINGNGPGTTDLRNLPTFPTINLSNLGAGTYYYRGTTALRLRGTVRQKITIAALNGPITIDGPITLSAASAPGNQAPSLGIIAAGDISINAAATQVDAYLFSDSTVITCSEGNALTCDNTLTVNGFLMAHALRLGRLGPKNGPVANVGEIINLTGQLYLNPPKFFDSASSTNLLQNLGERPPLL